MTMKVYDTPVMATSIKTLYADRENQDGTKCTSVMEINMGS